MSENKLNIEQYTILVSEIGKLLTEAKRNIAKIPQWLLAIGILENIL